MGLRITEGKFKTPMFLLIFLTHSLAGHWCYLHNMVNSCSQQCFLPLLASQMENQIKSKQTTNKWTNKQTTEKIMYIHLLSLTGPEFLQGSFPCKMQLLLGSKPGILYAESGYRGIRQTREGRVLCLRFTIPTLCQIWPAWKLFVSSFWFNGPHDHMNVRGAIVWTH